MSFFLSKIVHENFFVKSQHSVLRLCHLKFFFWQKNWKRKFVKKTEKKFVNSQLSSFDDFFPTLWVYVLHNSRFEAVRITIIGNSWKPVFQFFSKNCCLHGLKWLTNHWHWINLTVPANRAYQTDDLRNTEKSCFDTAFNVFFCPQVWLF